MDLTLGQKVKNARMSKGMTQQDVVGSFITRNMLSKIENDSATPSMRTVEYLARVLEVPLGYLMASMVETPAEESGIYGHQDGLATVRDALRSGDYGRCMQELSQLPSAILKADECHFVYALVYAHYAQEAQAKGDYKKAAEHAANALEYNAYGLYEDRALEAEMVLTLLECCEDTGECFANAVKLGVLTELPVRYARISVNEAIKSKDLTLAELLLSRWEESFSPRDVFILKGRLLMARQNFQEALSLLQQAEKLEGDSALYKELEACAKELGDFAMAYQYASKRLDELEK